MVDGKRLAGLDLEQWEGSNPLGQRQLDGLVESIAQNAFRGLVVEEELARRPNEEYRRRQVRRELTHEDQLDRQLGHGVLSAYAAQHETRHDLVCASSDMRCSGPSTRCAPPPPHSSRSS